MIAIADSGSSKAHWRLVNESGKIEEFSTIGLNPFHIDSSDFSSILAASFPTNFSSFDVTKVFFYGSGCAAEAMALKVKDGLSHFFSQAEIFVYSDVLGAARAIFQNEKGIIIILGTGASVAYYNGKSIDRKTPSLGYAIGDEGSGAYLGKELIRKWQYGELEKDIALALSSFCNLSLPEILHRIYREPFAGKFLASFVPFIYENINQRQIMNLVDDAFKSFTNSHLVRFDNFKTVPIGVVGSVGYQFKAELRKIIEKYGGKVSSFIQFPINGIQKYHLGQKDDN